MTSNDTRRTAKGARPSSYSSRTVAPVVPLLNAGYPGVRVANRVVMDVEARQDDPERGLDPDAPANNRVVIAKLIRGDEVGTVTDARQALELTSTTTSLEVLPQRHWDSPPGATVFSTRQGCSLRRSVAARTCEGAAARPVVTPLVTSVCRC